MAIHGPFAVGTEIVMSPPGQEAVRLRLAQVAENEVFVDEAEFANLLVRTVHRLDRLGADRTRVVYRTEISGPAADQVGPELGPAITADFPETMAALVRLAEDQ